MTRLLSLGLSLVINLGLVVALALASSSGAGGREERVSTVRAIDPSDPPEPEPEPDEPVPESALDLLPQAALPPIEAPELPSNLSSLAVPVTDSSLMDWSRGLDLPSFVGAGEREADIKEAMKVTRARILFQPDLRRFYPRNALEQGITGFSVVRIRVKTSGRVEPIQVLRSEPEGWFEEAAKAAARQFRYAPARRGGRPEQSELALRFEWEGEQG